MRFFVNLIYFLKNRLIINNVGVSFSTNSNSCLNKKYYLPSKPIKQEFLLLNKEYQDLNQYGKRWR